MTFSRQKNGKLKPQLKGRALLGYPLLNKGTAFTLQERHELGLLGILPPEVETMQQQLAKIYLAYKQKDTDLARYVFLRELQDRNETLFYRLIIDNIDEMLPVIYTPVVGLACQKFSEIYRGGRGLFISYPDRDRIEEIVDNIELPDVRVIVATDGERILGLGDQGIGGMGISIGKISLYTACGGVFPGSALPVILDTGTDNEDRLKDPFYFGWREKRVRGAAYEEFIDRFVKAITRKFPNVLIQWEDFAKNQARTLLDKYRNECCSFNDDIQGTAAVTLAGLLAGIKANQEKLTDQQIVIYGAGSAGTGIADQLVVAMQKMGLSAKEAASHIWMLNRHGLMHEETLDVSEAQRPYLQSKERLQKLKCNLAYPISLEEVIEKAHPHILIGVSSSPGAFTKKAIETMAQFVNKPIIFPLSNPDTKSEAQPSDLIAWTQGRALIATGTKFPDVSYQGQTYFIPQCNNYYIFPAVGLAILGAHIPRVSDTMLLAAAEELSNLSPALLHPGAPLFPPAKQVRQIAKQISIAVAMSAMKEGLIAKQDPGALKAQLEDSWWDPEY
jgi:malate dehydrogenase (oxaloacetate-decarboxylating)